jgi:hypothetical protein
MVLLQLKQVVKVSHESASTVIAVHTNVLETLGMEVRKVLVIVTILPQNFLAILHTRFNVCKDNGVRSKSAKHGIKIGKHCLFRPTLRGLESQVKKNLFLILSGSEVIDGPRSGLGGATL